VTPTKLPTEIPAVKRGILTALRALLSRHRCGAASRPVRSVASWAGVRRAGAVVAVLAGALIFAPSSLASGPPHFLGAIIQEVHTTRARMEATIDVDELETEWQVAYGPSASGPWTVTNAGVEPPIGNPLINVELGNESDVTGPTVLRHLTPDTTYYARFLAKNQAGETIEIVPFKTLPVEKPEIAQHAQGGRPNAFYGTTFNGNATGPHSAAFNAGIETNGARTEYQFEYAPAGTGLWTVCASGTVTVSEDSAHLNWNCTGLTPETTYEVRVKASNEDGIVEQTMYGGTAGDGELSTFTTFSARPSVDEPPSVRNVTAVSAHLLSALNTEGSATHWHFESSSSEKGPWTPIPGTAGAISQAQVKTLTAEEGGNPRPGVKVEAAFSGLSPATRYYVRLFAENECSEGCGEAENFYGEPISTATRGVAESFQTTGPPVVTTFATHALHGEALRLLGTVNPSSKPTSAEQTITIEGVPTGGTFTLTFDGQTTASLPYDAEAGKVEQALIKLPIVAEGEGLISVTGPDGGPYTVYFGEEYGEGYGEHNSLAGKPEPQIEADASGLTPSGSIAVAVTQQGGLAYDTHYFFEYEPETEGVAPFTHATSTAPVDIGSGETSEVVYAELPGLQAGAIYRYRIAATNTAPGNPTVAGEEHALTVPVSQQASAETCPNEALRTGPSANLPDCRAYEQLTPVEKEGAQQPFGYADLVGGHAYAAEDGERLMLEAYPVNWGAGPDAGRSPYFFTRTPEGWRLAGAAIEPELGVENFNSQVLGSDLTGVGFEQLVYTSPTVIGKNVEFRAGPPGGPYTTAAVVPRSQVAPPGHLTTGGWVAASADFSKLILQVEDRRLVEPATTTKTGFDLYEYAGGSLRQVNVGVGTCGAVIVRGLELYEADGSRSSSHAVSADGSRVFFEAVPGSNCSAAAHLYMRVNGEETVDIGAYKFEGSNPQGTRLLLKNGAGELLGYDTETGSTEAPSSAELATAAELSQLDIPAPVVDPGEALPRPRYTVFQSKGVAGVPGGASDFPHVYRYDSVEHVVECVSCASSSDPEPRLGAYLSLDLTRQTVNGALPAYTASSANGDYVFFSTPAALLPSDVDGEIAPKPNPAGEKGEFSDDEVSPSTDIYEWRRDGLDGCAQVQGCLALITNGRGGYLNLLLGSGEEGRDVFIYTSSRLVPQDQDTAGDIYDARVGGGFQPPPPGPVECEGAACSTPASPPNDVTPSSFTFAGAGNSLQSPSTQPAQKAKKRKPKARKTKRPEKKRGRKASKRHGKAKQSARRSK
jgi:hypothetical protein